MPADAPRPVEDATAALARESGEAADLDRAHAFADKAMLRAASSLLQAQRLAADMVADADRRAARDAGHLAREGPEVHSLGPQDSRAAFDVSTSDPAFPGAGDPHPSAGARSCPPL